jgi:hypothetical protein
MLDSAMVTCNYVGHSKDRLKENFLDVIISSPIRGGRLVVP